MSARQALAPNSYFATVSIALGGAYAQASGPPLSVVHVSLLASSPVKVDSMISPKTYDRGRMRFLQMNARQQSTRRGSNDSKWQLPIDTHSSALSDHFSKSSDAAIATRINTA
jgi:hypothetical protein